MPTHVSNNLTWLKGLMVVIIMFSWIGAGRAAQLQAGDPAPAFDLLDQNGQRQRLQDYAGRWLVLYFYPKDDTPGCTTEACAFRDDVFQFRRMNVALLGVSLDDVASHQEFAAKYHLPFPLLSDADGRVAEAYGALFSLGPLRFAKRHSFIIGPDGQVAKEYRDVTAKTHSAEIIADLKALGVPAE